MLLWTDAKDISTLSALPALVMDHDPGEYYTYGLSFST